MELIERLIIKLIIIQCVFLLFFQLIFHREDAFTEWKQLVKYEGVLENNYSEILETFINNK